MSTKPRKKKVDLAAQIEAHPGTAMLRAFQDCENANKAFESSSSDVRRIILALENPAGPLAASWPGERDKLEAAYKEIFRRFGQFLRSVEALVERTERAMSEDFVSAEHRAEHRAAAEKAFSEPEARFLKEFPAYMLRRADPAMTFVRYEVARPKLIELMIDAREMLHWGKWSSAARSFLHRFPAGLPVLRMIDGHQQRTRTYYHRFVQRFRRHCQASMDAAAALSEELYGPPSCPMPFFFGR